MTFYELWMIFGQLKILDVVLTMALVLAFAFLLRKLFDEKGKK